MGAALPFPEIQGLEDLWARNTRRAAPAPMTQADRMLLCLLGIGIEQSLIHLQRECPEFAEFTQWIRDLAGLPDPAQIARYHACLAGDAPPAATVRRLQQIDDTPDVLDAAAMQHWQQHGYVVVPQAITAQQAEAAAARIWQHIEADPDQPESWQNPQALGMWVPLYQAPELDIARQSTRVHKAFAQLWGTSDLWMLTDRTSFNPPLQPGQSFGVYQLHWDTSLAQPIPFGTQAILYLTDTTADQGALQLVPGFHRTIDAWLSEIGGTDPRQIDLSAQAVTIPAKAGDLIVWRHELPHGASPNRTDRPRLAQYLNMFPASPEDLRDWR